MNVGLVNTASGYSNVVALSVAPLQVQAPPVLTVRKAKTFQGEKFAVQWDDMKRAVVLEFSADPNFSVIVKTVSGSGAGTGGLFVEMPVGTYWLRATWQDAAIVRQ